MRSLYSSNFNRGFLLLNLPIEVTFDNFANPVIINIPTVKDMLYNNDINYFIEILNNKDIWKTNGRIIANSRKQMLCGAMQFLNINNLQGIVEKIFPNLKIDKTITFEDTEITDEQFDILFEMLLVSCNYMTFEEFENETKEETEEDKEVSEFLKRQKELQDKINSTKKNGSQIVLDKVLICVLSYFPQYKLEDLLKINYYTLFKLYEWAVRREYQFISDVAAGNGLMSKNSKYQPLF